METPTPGKVLKLNLASVARDAQVRLSRLSQRWRLAANGVASLRSMPETVPGVAVNLEVGDTGDKFAVAHEDAKRWIDALTVRDAAEIAAMACDEMFRLLCWQAIFAAGPIKAPRAMKSLDDVCGFLDSEIAGDLEKFEKAGVRNKLDILQNRFGLTPMFGGDVVSIQQARTCITHRLGLVRERDVKGSGSSELCVRFRPTNSWQSARTRRRRLWLLGRSSRPAMSCESSSRSSER